MTPTRIRVATTRGRHTLGQRLRAREVGVPRGRRSRLRPGVLSVVIPVHDVEQYLLECLRSVADQEGIRLEIIAVDDGSTDGSPQILAEFAAGDPRVIIVSKANAGLGAARNTGLAAATGEFLTFVDSDDLVPAGSYAAMMRTLGSTGSQFVVGCPQRMERGRTWVADWAHRLHAADRLAISLTDMPEIVGDVFAWNKVFRRAFFDDVVGSFPEGVRYEDQEPALRAYLGATSFDVLRRITYTWRRRPPGESITQQKAVLADLADRAQVMTRACEEQVSAAPEEVRRAWLGKALGFDLRPYFAEVPRTDEAYWAQLCDLVRVLAAHADDSAWAVARLNDRAVAWAALHGDRDDAVAILTSISALGPSYPVTSTPTGLLAHPPFLQDLGHPLPEDLRVVTGELELVALVDGWHWIDERTIGIRGAAHVAHLPDHVVPEGSPVTELLLVNMASGASRPLAVLPGEAGDPYTEAGDRWIAHRDARFRVEISTEDLQDPDVWHLWVKVRGGGVNRSGPIATVSSADSSGRLVVGPVIDGVRVVGGLRRTGPGQGRGLALSVRRPRWVVDQVRMQGHAVLELLALEAPAAARWSPVRGEPIEAAAGISPSADGRIRVTIPLPPGTEGPQVRLEFGAQDARPAPGRAAEPAIAWYPVEVRGCMDLAGEHGIGPLASAHVSTDAGGHVVLRPQHVRAIATGVELDIDDHVLTVSGVMAPPAQGAPELWMLPEGGGPPPIPSRVAVDGGRFVARFDLLDSEGRPHRPGSRYLTVVDGQRQHRVEVSRPVEAGLRREHVTPLLRVGLARTPRRGTLKLTLAAPLSRAERGAFQRNRLEEGYHHLVGAAPLRPAVLFECFAGRFSGDSVKQLSLELARSGRAADLGLDLLWSVRDLSVPVPESTTPVVRFSEEWFAALATSAYLVNNNNFPSSFRKAPGQAYVQTWHGTPLKRIGDDVPAASLSLRYRALMSREAAAWDHLLAQNQYSADIFTPAFGYAGPVHVLGYPRNDPLVGTGATAARRRARASLGLGDDQVLVLYTPTWRDSAKDDSGRYEMVSHLDLHDWFDRAPGHWVLGVRGHANTRGPRTHDDRVMDLTDQPDIVDLYLAADAMVTDYSSTMFDFSVTGRPMLFLVPDLAEYRDETRGFYFDLPEMAPGPLVSTTTELVAALGDLPGLAEAFTERYAQWRARFNPMDDGRAAQRVVQQIWG